MKYCRKRNTQYLTYCMSCVLGRPDERAVPASGSVGSAGDAIGALLKYRGMTQTELARRMQRPLKTINEIIHGKARLTEETALQIETHLQTSAESLLLLDVKHRLRIARGQNDQGQPAAAE